MTTPPTKQNIPHLDVTRAVIKAFKLHMGTVPMEVNGDQAKIKVEVNLVKWVDFFKQMNKEKTKHPAKHSITVSFPRTLPSHPSYVDRKNLVIDGQNDNSATKGKVGKPPDYCDLEFMIKLKSDHNMVLPIMMSQFHHMFYSGSFDLNVKDSMNGTVDCYDVDVVTAPDASTSQGNNDGIYTAIASIVVHGVTFVSGQFIEYDLIHKFDLIAHKPGQVVTVDESGNTSIV